VTGGAYGAGIGAILVWGQAKQLWESPKDGCIFQPRPVKKLGRNLRNGHLGMAILPRVTRYAWPERYGSYSSTRAQPRQDVTSQQGFQDRRDLSVEPCPAVDMDGLTGNKATIVTDEEQAGCSNFVDRALTSQGNAGGVWCPSLVPLGIGPRGIDTAW
jgi:hypothetical protein